MFPIHRELEADFDAVLNRKSVPVQYRHHYKKWLRYYWDFCHKYHYPVSEKESLPHFKGKLREKRQTEIQIKQASEAISLYYEMIRPDFNQIDRTEPPDPGAVIHDQFQVSETEKKAVGYETITKEDQRKYPEKIPAKTPESLKTFSWRTAYDSLHNEIKVRHYSPKTLKTYRHWLAKFQAFTKSKALESLSDTDIKEFLTFLAVKKNVSSSTQNQAFNALLFIYRHILKKEPGILKDTVRAKKKPYIPVVLSRQETDTVLQHLSYPYDLVVKFLYGCGLRLFECLNLRIHNFNFDARILTVHDGKGQKDRTVPLPHSIITESQAHLEKVRSLYEQDIQEGYSGTFMFGLMEKKYKGCAKELIWQWFFPAIQLTCLPETGEKRRYHLHESHVQKAVKSAVSKAGIYKRVSCHTFRHTYATHLLQANYDIRTIQELLGHSDVKTTMIYTHTIESRTLKELKSPLDF